MIAASSDGVELLLLEYIYFLFFFYEYTVI